MNRFLLILAAIFLIALIIQQSHLFEKVKVLDTNLNTYKDEYHINWNNFNSYFGDLFSKIKKIPSEIRKRIKKKKKTIVY